jgi:MFS family permease
MADTVNPASPTPSDSHGEEYPADTQRQQVGKLTVLMITAFIDMLGVLMIVPLLPFYASDLGGNGFIVGLLVSAFSVAQLLSAPLWGRFSDKHGRRPALLVGLMASMIAYIVFAFADSLWLLFLSRLIQGAGGGTVSVIQAYVADTVQPNDRAKALGWLSAATNAGVALGPVVPIVVRDLGPSAPGLIAAGFCVLNMIFASKYLVEVRKPEDAARQRVPGRNRAAVLHVLTNPSLPSSRLIQIYAVSIGAFQGTTSILALFLAVRFKVTADNIGYFFMYIGVLSVVMRAWVLGKALDKWGEAQLSRIGIVMMAAGLVGISFSWDYVTLALSIALLPAGTAFTFPGVTALLSKVIPSAERGLYMGVQQTYGGITRVAMPPFLGWAFDQFGYQSPLWIAAGLVLGTLMLGRDLEKYSPRTAVART